jgi:AcrR family transcriptional regulator
MRRRLRKTRTPTTPRGWMTKRRLLAVAQRVFEKGNFYETSVSEICRRAGVALGTFYQYFEDKEAIFSELAAHLSHRMQAELKSALSEEGDLPTRLDRTLEVFFRFVRRHRAFYQIFREAEFVNPRVHHRFYDGVIALLSRSFAEALSDSSRTSRSRSPLDLEIAAVAVIGIAHFLTLRWIILDHTDVPPEARQTALDLLLHGIEGDRPSLPSPIRPRPSPPRDHTTTECSRGERSRRRLVEAARWCFGRRGFYATSIADITRRAGLSLGTFYLYFSSKTEILDELVRDLNTQLRRNVRAAIAGLHDRRAIEREGFRAFFRFIRQNREAYRIVREAEFVNPSIARWYFERLAQGYRRGLQEGMARRDIRSLDPETLAYCLMGIGHFFGLRWVVRSGSMPKRVFDRLMDLILHGLKGPKR